MINLKRLKEVVTKLLPNNSVLRNVLLNESDELSEQDFVSKVSTWLAIADAERVKDDV